MDDKYAFKKRESPALDSLIHDFCGLLRGTSLSEIESVTDTILETVQNDGCVYICGNGGSGSNANQFADVLHGCFRANRVKARVISLNASMPILTASAEKFGYEHVFDAQMEGVANKGDLLIAISGSGNSPNVLEAVKAARQRQMTCVGLTGMGGGKLSAAADFSIVVRSDSMEQIENLHTAILYAVAENVAHSLHAPCENNVLRRSMSL